MARNELILLGGGGHAKVVLEALKSAGKTPLACLDPDVRLHGKDLEGVPVKGGDELLSQYPSSAFALVLGIGAPRTSAVRRTLFERYRAQGYAFPPVVAASALCSESSSLGAGTQILTRAVVHPGAVIGDNTIVNTGAIVEHDCRVGDHVHIAPGTVLCGSVRVDSGAFIGAGAVILPGLRVGRGALVAAGMVLRKDCPAGGRAVPREGQRT